MYPKIQKGALKWIMKNLNCTSEKVVACSDHINDLSTLKDVVHSKEDGAIEIMQQLVFRN